jgi:hypothetical protein
MTIISDDWTTIYNRDGSCETLRADLARNRVHFAPHEWSLTPPAPLNWQYEKPRYLVTRDLQPAQRERYRSEPPFSEMAPDTWQFGERFYAAGETVETTAWPHASMTPLTFSAQKILEFFKAEMKSRLPQSPWHGGQVRLGNGLTQAPAIFDVKPPQIQAVNLRGSAA